MKKILTLIIAILAPVLSIADTMNVPVKNLFGLEGTLTSGSTQYGFYTDESGNSYIETYNPSTQEWDKTIKIPAYLSSIMFYFDFAKDKKGQIDKNKAIVAIQGPEYIYILGIDFPAKSTTQLAALQYSLEEALYGEYAPSIKMGDGFLYISVNNLGAIQGWSVDIEPYLTDSPKTDNSPQSNIAKIPDSEV